MSRLEYFDVIGLFLKSCAAHVNTERIGRGEGEKGKNYNLKFRKTKEIFLHSLHNHISPTLKVLDFHLLVQQYTHSGHKIMQVRSSTYHFFNGLLQINLQGKTWYYSLLHVRHKSQQFQVSVHMGFCTVHRSRLETYIWHML